MMKRLKPPFLVLFFCTLVSAALLGANCRPALATESAFGRYIPGVFAGPSSEIVPPVPGFYWQNETFFYRASAGKNLSVPFGGAIRSDLKINFYNFSLSGIWVPDWNPAENVNVALGFTVPIQSLKVRADVSRFSTTDHSDGLGDLVLTPAIGYHWGHHLASLNVSVYLPTGRYRVGDLANIGLNHWTFTPSLAYTYLNPEAHVDFSVVGGVDFNTKNKDTDYRSGAMGHVDATLLATFDQGQFGAGLFGSALYQLSDDKGPLADRLDGFRGRSFAIGPMIKYTGAGKHGMTVNLNWAPEFNVKNRLKGDAFYLNVTGRF